MNLEPYLNVKTGKAFRDKTLKSLTIKEKIDKLDFMKIKNFCHSGSAIKKMKRYILSAVECLQFHSICRLNRLACHSFMNGDRRHKTPGQR